MDENSRRFTEEDIEIIIDSAENTAPAANTEPEVNGNMTYSLFDAKKTGKSFSVIGFALLAFLGLAVLVTQILPYLIPQLRTAFQEMDSNLYMGIFYILLYGIGFLLFVLIVRKLPKDEIPKQKMSFGRLFIILAMMYPLITAGNLTGNLIEYAISPENSTLSKIMEMFSVDSVLPDIIAVLVAPVVEELVFRKMLIDRTKRYGEKAAILFSAVCFGLYHRTIPQLLYATALGLFFGYVYSRSGKIRYTMIMHAVINGVSAIMLFLSSKEMTLFESLAMGIADSLDSFLLVLITILLLQLELLVFGTIIVGIVFLCKKLKKVQFTAEGPYCIPKEQLFSTMWLNWGVIVLAAVCVGLTFAELLFTGTSPSPSELQFPGDLI